MIVAGCGFLPTTEPQEFTVSALPPVSPAKPLRNQDPNLSDREAKDYCADSYEKVSETTAATDDGTLNVQRVKCAPYSFRLF